MVGRRMSDTLPRYNAFHQADEQFGLPQQRRKLRRYELYPGFVAVQISQDFGAMFAKGVISLGI